MLKGLRKRTKLIIWSVVITFILWGGFSFGLSMRQEGRYAGEVFGRNVSFQEYDLFFRSAQIFSFTGKAIEDPEVLKQQAWLSLMISYEAKNRHIQVTDEEVRNEVFRLLAAHQIENPTPELYRRWLEATVRESPQQFEKQIRELLRIQKLIRQINEKPLEQPSEEDVLRVFLLEKKQLSAEMAQFPTREEADAFLNETGSLKAWNGAVKQHPEKFATVDLRPLSEWILEWGVSEPEITALHKLEPDRLSGVVPMKGQFAVLRILRTEAAPQDRFEAEFKDEYLQKVTERRKSERFFSWIRDLNLKAGLKDFLPGSEKASLAD